MGSLFHPDSKLMRALTKLSELFILSLVWFFFSLPVITAGASTTALYYAVNKSLIHNNGYAWLVFWEAFKANFRQSTIAWLFVLLFYALSILDFFIFHSFLAGNANSYLDYIVLIVMLLLVIAWGCYVFPCIARFQNTTKLIMRNAFIIAFCNLPRTLVLCVLFVIALLMVLSFPPLLAIVPAAYMCCARHILERIFRKYTTPEDLAAEEERNRVCAR